MKSIEFERYLEYKDSGVEWLGEIPKHWELARLGTRFTERRTKVSDKDYPALSVTKNGIVPQLETAAKTNDGDNRKLVKKGDFVINSRSDRKGSSGISFKDGSVSLINIVLKPRDIDPLFCNYLLKGTSFIEEFYRVGRGIVADLWTTRYDEMKNIKIGTPPLQEQIAIAKFLDEKCNKIDKAITQKERLIKLLNERKQIIIQKAVTKGLNPDTEMKKCEIELFEEIPSHWKLLANRHIFKLKKTQVGKKSNEYDLLSLTLKGIIKRDMENPEGKFPADFDTYQEVKKGDFVFCLFDVEETPRTVGLSNYNGMITGAYTVLEANDKFDKKYLYYFYLNLDLKKRLKMLYKGLRNTIPKPSFLSFKTFVPPFEEQEKIVSYIEEETKKIDNAVLLQEKQIQKLKEYREILIDNAVTGKIKVGD